MKLRTMPGIGCPKGYVEEDHILMNCCDVLISRSMLNCGPGNIECLMDEEIYRLPEGTYILPEEIS
jgi:hypothetical protein